MSYLILIESINLTGTSFHLPGFKLILGIGLKYEEYYLLGCDVPCNLVEENIDITRYLVAPWVTRYFHLVHGIAYIMNWHFSRLLSVRTSIATGIFIRLPILEPKAASPYTSQLIK
jgi:hypothetical protein